MGLRPSMRKRDPRGGVMLAQLGCGPGAVHPAVLTGVWFLGKMGPPRETGLVFPSPTLHVQRLTVLESFYHLRDWEEERDWPLLLPSLGFSPLHALWCLFLPIHPLPLSLHSYLLTIPLESLSFHPFYAYLLSVSSILPLHSLAVQLLVSFLTSLSKSPDLTGWL